MLSSYKYCVAAFAALGVLGVALSPAQAITVTIDGVSSPTLLSDAVDTCMTAGAGPHVINITADSLPVADRQLLITQPITINGDADNDNIPCDILVDMTGIKAAADLGLANKSYIEIQAVGNVAINSLKIHPNADGDVTGTVGNIVSGIRVFKPLVATDVSNVTLTRVYVSGSDTAGNYVPLDTGADLYNSAGIKRWGGLNGTNDGNYAAHGAIHFSNASPGTGIVNLVLDHCHMGLSRGLAAAFPGEGGSISILGGVYGHSARDGIRVSGTGASIVGTITDRVRVVRSANLSGNNSHSIEVVAGGTVSKMEYVDVAGCTTANALSHRDGTTTEINYFRALGKFDTPAGNNNEQLVFSTTNNFTPLIRNLTAHGAGVNACPLNIFSGVDDPKLFRDCIFTSSGANPPNATTATLIQASPNTAILTLENCALPTDGLAGESLANPPITTAANNATPPSAATVVNTNPVSASPQYMLTLADYDWSDAQGAGNPLNGAGNRNVLRPALANPAYLTASSTGGRLTGGAGPDAASIGDWMMMED